MNKTDKQKKRAELVKSKIQAITKHIRNVEDNCLLLGTKLIERGDIELGRMLIANGFVHDASKFHGIEFEYLSSSNNPNEDDNKLKLRLAIQHHNLTNPHHPEHWSEGIKGMPDVYLAEFCCDIKARSEEFGTSLRDWIDTSATKKFGFEKTDEVYRKIMEFVDLICEKPFEQI